jgi:uncharacterized protein
MEEIGMENKKMIKRRTTLKGFGLFGALSFFNPAVGESKDKTTTHDIPFCPGMVRKGIWGKVFQTPFIDTHEHLFEEKERLAGTACPGIRSDDWTILFNVYIFDDMMVSGMSQDTINKFFSPQIDPLKKWELLKPFWPYIKNTGYGQAVCIAIKELYGVDDLSEKTVGKVQAGYEKVRQPGFYTYILKELAHIESCQINSINPPFKETDMPTFLMQDISFLGMHTGPDFKKYSEPAGITVTSLSDWHRIIDWWFAKYGKYAVAVKSQDAYNRDIDYEKVPAEKAAAPFLKLLNKELVTDEEKKLIEDHLFWYAVERATEYHLPVKLHTGYYVGHDRMPLSRVMKNPGSASDLCRNAPQTTFVFFHIGYPYYEEMIALAKQNTNAYMDMCWSWIINPVAAKDFLKKFLVTAPSNKIFTFGGDLLSVETVLGHAIMARRGIALALSELVEEGWMSEKNALELIDPIMHGNAERIFNLSEKTKVLEHVPWK